MSTPRTRLAAQATAAGYPPALLADIAAAALTSYERGQRLTDTQVGQVADAVEVLAQAGYDPDQVTVVLADYRQQHGDQWRHRFWERTLALAAVRYRHPEFYGLSPCETDPDRLARSLRAPAATG